MNPTFKCNLFIDIIVYYCISSHLPCCFLPLIVSSTFRLDPPGQAISTATQELLRLAEANPGGLASLDPVNDLQLKNIDVVTASMRLRVLQDSLKEFNCIHSPTFPEQVGFRLDLVNVFFNHFVKNETSNPVALLKSSTFWNFHFFNSSFLSRKTLI